MQRLTWTSNYVEEHLNLINKLTAELLDVITLLSEDLGDTEHICNDVRIMLQGIRDRVYQIKIELPKLWNAQEKK